MTDPGSSPLRDLLAAQDGPWSGRSPEVLALVYEELRSLARVLMAKLPPGNTLQATALVHEAYLRLLGPGDHSWKSRGHFFAAAAQAMRHILIDQARRKAAAKHGGGWHRLIVQDVEIEVEPPSLDLLALDEALTRLESEDARKYQIVMLRYFAGLTEEEIATVLDTSLRTVQREWRFARVLLADRLQEGPDGA